MGILNALDVCLISASKVLFFFRDFWSCLPMAVRALIYVSFGLFVLFGLIKMIF